MKIITLTSDYGLLDWRVSAIKGSILSEDIAANIIDISHNIEAYNLLQTSHILRSAYKYYPRGTVHVVCVDSFFHKDRKNIIVKADGHYFICADNGLVSLVFSHINVEEMYEITLHSNSDNSVNFTSIDIFVPVALHLSKGGIPELIGKKITNIKENLLPRAVFNEVENIIVGEIFYVDNFGNAITNISKHFFDKTMKLYNKFHVKIRNFSVPKIGDNYTDIVDNWEKEQKYHGDISAIFGEDDFLEISIYKGNRANGASSLLGLSVGERIFIEFCV